MLWFDGNFWFAWTFQEINSQGAGHSRVPNSMHHTSCDYLQCCLWYLLQHNDHFSSLLFSVCFLNTHFCAFAELTQTVCIIELEAAEDLVDISCMQKPIASHHHLETLWKKEKSVHTLSAWCENRFFSIQVFLEDSNWLSSVFKVEHFLSTTMLSAEGDSFLWCAQLKQQKLVHASLLLVYICVLVRVCVERPKQAPMVLMLKVLLFTNVCCAVARRCVRICVCVCACLWPLASPRHC